MDFTNELDDNDFEEQENEMENQDSELQTKSTIDQSITIDYYKKLLQTLTKRINKINDKLHHNRKIQLQFSMLLNKTVENQFGAIIDDIPKQKQAVPPLPPIHKESRSEIIRLIHNGTPSEVTSYFQKSNVISLLLFSDTSVFDERLKESLMRASPDIQVSFFNSTMIQIKSCGEFIDRLVPLLSKYSNEPLLRSQIFDTHSNYTNFYKGFYTSLLKEVCNLTKIRTVKAVFSSSDFLSLIYPTDSFCQVISGINSACSTLTKKAVTHLTSPQKMSTFEVVSEGPLFEDFTFALGIRFGYTQKGAAGEVIALSDDRFTASDESSLSVAVSYISPLLKLVRSILIHQTPSDFSSVSQASSRMRIEGKPSEFESVIADVCGASSCRLLVSKPSNLFSDLESIGDGCSESIVGRAASTARPIALSNPRRSPDFLRAADDCAKLPKIRSMLAVPVRGCEFVFALYNSVKASDFSPSQREAADAVSRALSPILSGVRRCREVEGDAAEGDEERSVFESCLSHVGSLTESCIEGDLFDAAIQSLTKSCSVTDIIRVILFVRLKSGDVMRFPGGELVEVSDVLSRPDSFFVTSDFDINIDAMGDTRISILTVTKSLFCTAIVASSTPFEGSDLSFIRSFSQSLLMLAPFVMLDFSLRQAKESHQLLRDTTRLSSPSFSRLISGDVDLVLFEAPLESDPEIEGAPLVVSIETARGIEAALAAHDASPEIRAASITYAEWLTATLSSRVTKQTSSDPSSIPSLLVKHGASSIFECSESDVSLWCERVITVSRHPKPSEASLSFIASILSREPWHSFFTKSERLLILLSSFARDVTSCWDCKTDTKTVKVLKKWHDSRCPVLASVFASGFGLNGQFLDSVKKEALADSMAKFVMPHDASMESLGRVLAHLRQMSLRGFKKSKGDVKWLGISICCLARAAIFKLNVNVAAKKLVDEFGDDGARSEIFAAERVYLPILSFMSSKDQELAKVSNEVRNTILELRKIFH